MTEEPEVLSIREHTAANVLEEDEGCRECISRPDNKFCRACAPPPTAEGGCCKGCPDFVRWCEIFSMGEDE